MAYEVVVTKVRNPLTKRVKYADVDIKEGQYGMYKKYGEEWKFIRCGGAVYLKCIYIDLDTQEIVLELFFDRCDGRVSIKFPRSDLNDTKILKLNDLGVQVKKNHAVALIKTIENQETEAKHVFRHKTLGISTWQGKTIFKGYKAIGVDSMYYGELRIFPVGSYQKWKQVVQEEVVGHVPLEFTLAVAVSGIIVDWVKEKLSVENIVCHYIGESSTGKTTAALLAVSTGSAPDTKSKNFVLSFKDTPNSLMHCLPNSYPAVIDEGSLLEKKDATHMMYSLSSGVEKKRMTPTSDVKEPVLFRTAVILTSEKSILASCNQNSGLLVRNFEYDNIAWTKSGESADRIKKVIENNYGHVIPMIAEKLLKIQQDKVVDKIRTEAGIIVEHAKETDSYNNLTERVAKQEAIILTSVDMINSFLGLGLNKEAIREFIEDNSLVKDKEQVSIGKRAMEWLLQSIVQNHSQFLTEKINSGVRDCRGRLVTTKEVLLKNGDSSTLRLLISEAEFTRILKEGKFCEKKIILKQWKEEYGYLKAPKDRYISSVVIFKDIKVQGYIIMLPVKAEEIDNEAFKSKTYGTGSNVNERDIKYLTAKDDKVSFDEDDDIDFPEDKE